MTNVEGRKKDEYLMSKGPHLLPISSGWPPSGFAIRHSFVIDHSSLLARFLVRGVLALLAAELLQREPVGPAGFLLGAVVPGAARRAFEPDVFTHENTSRTAR